MNPQTKKMLKSGLISGLLFAVFMAGFQYFNGEDFKIGQFAFHFIIFGLGMAFIQTFQQQKTPKDKQ